MAKLPKSKAKRARPATPPRLPPLTPVPMLHVRWVVLLLIQGHANDHVRRQLENDSLPCPPDDELDALRAAHRPPANLRARRPEVEVNQAFLDERGIKPFFDETAEAIEAVRVLRTPRARELLEAGLIVGVPYGALAQALARTARCTVSAGAVRLYASTFFDLEVTGRAELRLLVQARVTMAVARVAGPDDHAALRRAVVSDPRMTAVALSRSTLAWSSVLMSAGWAPNRVELAKVVDEIETVAVLRSHEAMVRGAPEDDRRAEGFVNVVQRLRQIRESTTTPDEAVRKVLSSVRLRHDPHPLPNINDISSGNHSVEFEHRAERGATS